MRTRGTLTSIWVRRQHCDKGIRAPFVSGGPWPPTEGDETWQGPQWLQHANKCAFVQSL